MKVMTVIGTRPEAIKMARVIRELDAHPAVDARVCVTGQHREMLDPMLDLFEIESDHDLAVMRPGQTLTDTTQAVLGGMGEVLEEERPDWVLVQGDTTTVMATSLAAFYQRINVGHVEAGLRTFDKYAPFPEEVNRRIAGVVADLHFAPTEWAASNLRREGVPESRIHVTGNTVIDSLLHVGGLDFDPAGTPLEALPLDGRRLALVTAHRSENFGDGMDEICLGLKTIAQRHPELHLAYPVHLNPKARWAAYAHLDGLPNVTLLPPLDYQPLVWLLKRAHIVITDSGGLQEEAAGIGKPVLVLRDTTERPEGVEAGIAQLVGANQDSIVSCTTRLLEDEHFYRDTASVPCPYGDGTASLRIVDRLVRRLDEGRDSEHIYEQPRPEHPLDALLRQAGAAVQAGTSVNPGPYADRVLGRFKRRAHDRSAV